MPIRWNSRNLEDKLMDIELQSGAKHYHSKPYPVPQSHKASFCKEVELLFQLGVLKKVNCSEWGAPTFTQPKNNETVQLLSNFRKLNQFIHRKQFMIPKIQDMLLKLEGVTYV